MEKISLANGKEIDSEDVIRISKEAGKKIMEVYEKDFKVYEKEDTLRKEGHSALTEADIQSNKFINDSLKKIYPDIPIITEENMEIPFEERKKWEYFWLVDPLDGTKDFIKRNGEFTVNIALIEGKSPILGVVYAPVKDILYFGDRENGSFKRENGGEIQKLPLEKKQREAYKVVASRGSFNKETEEFIENLKKEHPKIELINIGSSLKFCMVAEGEADIYPRLGETSEWDTAAAHAIVKFAGKGVYDFKKGDEIKYNKENLLNPWFIVK